LKETSYAEYRDYVVYELWSKKHEKKYVGMSSNSIARFKSHNEKGKKGWTIKFRPWKMVFTRFFKTKAEALAFEKFLKSGKGREWRKNNIKYE